MNSDAYPPVPADGLPPGWSMEQWHAYGALWIEQEPQRAAETAPARPTEPPTAGSQENLPVLSPEPVYPSDVSHGEPIQPLANTTPTRPTEPPSPEEGVSVESTESTFSERKGFPLGVKPSTAPFSPEVIVVRPSLPVNSSSPAIPTSTSPPAPFSVPRRGKGRKGLVIVGSIITLLVVSMLVLALLPAGTLGLMDDVRDRDDDGLTDAEELALGTNPERADTDGDGLLDPDEDCPAGDASWTSTSSTDHDGDGCRDSGEDLDDDGDGISDSSDACPRGKTAWISYTSTDGDGDGCKDSSEDLDDDNDGWSDVDESNCQTNPTNRFATPADFDGDRICDRLDSDDDNDGYADLYDIFPFDSSEWEDFDEDGIGDNADNDDDNDGILDVNDYNDHADVGIRLSLDAFKVITQMDYFDSQAEVQICMYIDGQSMGCAPDGIGYYWSMTTLTQYSLDFEYYSDLLETQASHEIKISVWDQDAFEDDRIDISPDSGWSSYVFSVDSTQSIADSSPTTVTTSGLGDSTGWDGELTFTYELVDFREQRMNSFTWEYDNREFSMGLILEYDTYSQSKNLDHTVGGIYDVESYARFATPDADYVIDLANDLESKAIANGYTSTLEIAEFIYAFVGAIQYVLDIEGTGVSDYPKYPIEMLWEASGDCEDAAVLFISLIEALGYDAMIGVGLVKQSSEEDWIGHAWAIVNIPDHSGSGWYGTGSKSDTPFYFVETTGYWDGTSYIGRNPWYDTSDESFYDVE